MKVLIMVARWIWWNAVVGRALVCSFVLIMVATWIWWNARAVVRRSLVFEDKRRVLKRHTHEYKKVIFTTKNATKTSYTQFIEALRAQLASGEERHGIPVMRERSTVRDSQRFVLVELSNWASDSPVTVAVDVTNAYVVAYRTGSQSFFLKEDNPDPAIRNPFPVTEQSTLSFCGNYISLQNCGGNRKDIYLGMGELEKAITELRVSDTKNPEPLARSLIVVIQMVVEAARFGYVEDQVRERIPKLLWLIPVKFAPDPIMLSLENNWKALSKAIQQSNQQGGFSRPVELRSIRYAPVYVVSVQDCIKRSKLAIMLFVPRTDGQPSPRTRGKSSRACLCRRFPRNRL